MKPSKNNKNIKKKKALLIANGSISDYRLTVKTIEENYGSLNDFYIVAADGGARHCINLKLLPDAIIGDMDSITAKVLERLNKEDKEIKFLNSSPQKDESDTQLALDYLVKSGLRQVLLIGVLGNRMDHSFANLVLLASNNYDGLDIRIISENSEIFIVKKTCSIKGAKGDRISLFSLTPCTFFKKTTGLKYSLKNEELLFSPVRGLSNEFIKDTVRLDFSDGILMVIKQI